MRILLLILNLAALLAALRFGFVEYSRPANDAVIVLAIFGSGAVLAALNLGYILATPATLNWGRRASRFAKAWKESSDETSNRPH